MANNDEYLKILKQLDGKWHAIDENRIMFLREVLSWLKNPDQKLKIIHVAGTNGKSSTIEMLNEVLVSANYKVGKFLTPSLYTSREQITINNELITTTDFVYEFNEINKVLKVHKKNSKDLSAFEWWTIIALNYFSKSNLDFVILEVGIGGKLDATNAIYTSLINVFTKITFDHQNVLGDTLQEITNQKSGILRPDAWVINYSGQPLEVQNVINKKINDVGAHLYQNKRPTITVYKATPAGSYISVDDQDMFLGLSGQFQLLNLNTVIQTINVLNSIGYKVTKDDLKEGLENCNLPGRMEYDSQKNILRDLAHNPDGIDALLASLKSWRLPFKPTVILGVLRDKNYVKMLEKILPYVSRIIAVTPANKTRGLTGDELAAQILEMDNDVEVIIADDPTAAVTIARQVRESSQALIVITGSIYTLRAVKGINF